MTKLCSCCMTSVSKATSYRKLKSKYVDLLPIISPPSPNTSMTLMENKLFGEVFRDCIIVNKLNRSGLTLFTLKSYCCPSEDSLVLNLH